MVHKRSGILKLRKDRRDFKYHRAFGSVSLIELPDEYILPPLEIKDQGGTDMCTAFALSAVLEDEEGVLLSPDYQFAKTRQLMGEYQSYGADLRMAAKTALAFGCLEKVKAPFSYQDRGRDFVANWGNWPAELDAVAANRKHPAFFAVTGPYDVFDNIRSAMWLSRAERRSVMVGCDWFEEWNNTPNNGIVSEVYLKFLTGHAFKGAGWKKINGETYLVGQLSNGKKIGENGMLYFSRAIVNKEFGQYGLFTFRKVTAETVKNLQAQNLTLLQIILELLYKAAELLKMKILWQR